MTLLSLLVGRTAVYIFIYNDSHPSLKHQHASHRGNLQLWTLTSSEDRVEVSHNAALHRGLQCLLFSEVFFKSKEIVHSRVIPYSFWQTVKTKMKRCTMQHPIMVHTVYSPPRQHISQSMVHTEWPPLWQTVKTPMKCHIMRHLIRVHIVCCLTSSRQFQNI